MGAAAQTTVWKISHWSAHTRAHPPSGEAAEATARAGRRVSQSTTRPSPPAVTSEVAETSAAAATLPPAAQLAAGLLGLERSSHLHPAAPISIEDISLSFSHRSRGLTPAHVGQRGS